jgi:hypothetical protein
MNDTPCRVSADLRNRDAAQARLLDLASFMVQAQEEIVEKLVEGKNVHRVNSRDIFDAAVGSIGNDVDYHRALDLLEDVLALNRKTGDDFRLAAHDVARKAKEFVERFVEGKDDWVEERAAELRRDAREDA